MYPSTQPNTIAQTGTLAPWPQVRRRGRNFDVAGGRSTLVSALAVALTLAAIVFGPPLTIIPGAPAIYVGQIVAPVVCCWRAMVLLHRHRLRFSGMYLWGVFMAGSISLSIVYAPYATGQTAQLRDYFEIPKLVLLLMAFAVGYQAQLNSRSLRLVFTALSRVSLAVAVFGIIQYLAPGRVDNLIRLYSFADHNYTALYTEGRVFGTFGNANVFGEYLSCALVLHLLAFLGRIGRRTETVVALLTIAVATALTGSRYAILCVILGCALAFYTASKRQSEWRISAKKLRAVLGLSFLFCTLGVAIWSVQRTDQHTVRRFQEFISDPMQVGSLRTRLDDTWQEGFAQFSASPLIGNGPAKSLFSGTYIDSEFLDMLRAYGLIGFVIYLSVFIGPAWALRRTMLRLKKAAPRDQQALAAPVIWIRFGFAVSIMAMVMAIGMSTFYEAQFGTFVWLVIGLALGCAESAETSLNAVPAKVRRPF